MGIASVLLGVLKVSYKDGSQPLVGRDISISLMVFIIKFGCFFGVVVYLQVIIHFLLGFTRTLTSASKERITQRLSLLGFYSWYLIPASMIFGILPMIAIAYPSHSKKLGMAHLIGFGSLVLIYSLITGNCLFFLMKELNIYIDSIETSLSKDIKTVVQRLKLAYIAVVGSGLIFSIAYIIFASSNYLFHLTTYFNLFLYISVSPSAILLVITVSGVTPSNNTQVVPFMTDEEEDKDTLDTPGKQ